MSNLNSTKLSLVNDMLVIHFLRHISPQHFNISTFQHFNVSIATKWVMRRQRGSNE